MAARAPGKHAITFIFITVLIDMIGFGLIIPVMPSLMEDLTGLPPNEAVVLGGFLTAVYALTQFVFAPIVGGLSDRFGRKPILIAALAGFAIDYTIMGFAPTYWLLFIGRLLAGVFGASYATANAYIADITPPEKRAGRFGLIGAAFGLGFIIGPALGGMLGEFFGPRAPFFAAAVLAAGNLVYGLIVLPETLKPENRRKFDILRANPFGSLWRMRKYPAVLILLGAVFLMMLGHSVYPAIWSYFAAYRFAWSEWDIGASLMFVGVTTAIVQGGLTRILVPKLGEWRAIGFSVGLGVLSYAAYGLVTEGWMVYVVILIGAIGGIGGPALQGVMSRIVPPNAQGELQGAMTSLQSLSMIIGPLAMSRVFAYFAGDTAPFSFPGAPFLMAAGLTLLALIIALGARKRDPGPEAGDDPTHAATPRPSSAE